jgi:hypothetical protein
MVIFSLPKRVYLCLVLRKRVITRNLLNDSCGVRSAIPVSGTENRKQLQCGDSEAAFHEQDQFLNNGGPNACTHCYFSPGFLILHRQWF